jgi:uncharacterized protein (TIGR04141 family)
MIHKYQPFKPKLVATVALHYGDETARRLEAVLGEKWTVEFQIADIPMRDGNFNIPFFSKLSLQDEARDIEAMPYNVRVCFIKQDRDSLATRSASRGQR